MNIKNWIMKRYMELAEKIGIILAKVVMGGFMAVILYFGYKFLLTGWYLFFTTK
jgi:hypothetical protein